MGICPVTTVRGWFTVSGLHPTPQKAWRKNLFLSRTHMASKREWPSTGSLALGLAFPGVFAYSYFEENPC